MPLVEGEPAYFFLRGDEIDEDQLLEITEQYQTSAHLLASEGFRMEFVYRDQQDDDSHDFDAIENGVVYAASNEEIGDDETDGYRSDNADFSDDRFGPEMIGSKLYCSSSIQQDRDAYRTHLVGSFSPVYIAYIDVDRVVSFAGRFTMAYRA
jgi:hypothetical protein